MNDNEIEECQGFRIGDRVRVEDVGVGVVVEIDSPGYKFNMPARLMMEPSGWSLWPNVSEMTNLSAQERAAAEKTPAAPPQAEIVIRKTGDEKYTLNHPSVHDSLYGAVSAAQRAVAPGSVIRIEL